MINPESFSLRAFCQIILSPDASKVDLDRKGVKQTREGFPVIWAKNYGNGRVLL
jgi:hypothetical protein